MYPLVDFALQAQGYVSKGRSFFSDAPFGLFHTQWHVTKERRLLRDAPFDRFPEALARRRPRIRGEIFLSFFFLVFHFGRSLAQLIWAALSLYPFEVKEGPGRHFLSDVRFGRFQLPHPRVRQ